MHRGKIERTIHAHLIAHPDEAFSTDDLCGVCYGTPVERKHRVAVLRAIDKVLAGLPDWRSRWRRIVGGNMLVFFNAASIPSTAKAAVRNWWQQDAAWDEPTRLAQAEQDVAEHTIMRDGSEEQRRQLTERRDAERQLHMAKLNYAASVRNNPIGVLLQSSRMQSGNLSELAEKARRLITENDPDAIRAGLTELANALDGLAREMRDPMETIRENLAA